MYENRLERSICSISTGTYVTGDPRVRRTRRRLHESLLHLTIERGYDAVTVQDVLVHSETARSTFYAHFRDKDDLLLSGFQDSGVPLFGTLFDVDSGADPFAQFAYGLFAHVYENKALAKAVFGENSAAIMMGHLRNMIVVEARRLMVHRSGAQKNVADELAVQFVASTAFSLLSWWIDHDFPISVDQMGTACHGFISNGLTLPRGVPEPTNK